MINRQTRQWIVSCFVAVVRIGLGCMFLWSSLPKIRQPYDFLSAVYSYELVGPRLGMLVAMTLPWMELLVGICLLGGVFVSGALLASTGMGALFTFVLASALYRGIEISCGCFNTSAGDKISYLTLFRAIFILLLSLAAYLAVILAKPGAQGESTAENLVPVC
jgi:putative oxidoreductase